MDFPEIDYSDVPTLSIPDNPPYVFTDDGRAFYNVEELALRLTVLLPSLFPEIVALAMLPPEIAKEFPESQAPAGASLLVKYVKDLGETLTMEAKTRL